MTDLVRHMRRMSAFLPVLLTVSLALWLIARPALAATCAAPGRDGTATSLGGIVNTYFPGGGTAAGGATSITLGAGGGASVSIAVGDMLAVVQMQDATINTSNSSAYGSGGTAGAGQTGLGAIGQAEYVRATSAVGVGGGTVGIAGTGAGGGLNYTYNTAAATGTRGQRSFQVIRVPQYVDATLHSNLTALAWDGAKGGVLALDVAGALTGGGSTVSVSGLGFRGGGGRKLTGQSGGAETDYATSAGVNNNGAKGEGVAGTPRFVNNGGSLLDTGVEGYPGGSQARGAPGNAGGGGTDGDPASNDQNTGGGGGGNAGAGGQGGYAWCSGSNNCSKTGGVGGASLGGVLAMGGGGGAGVTNDGTGTPGSGIASSGAAGGGIILIRATTLTGAMTFYAEGAAANSTVGNDGSGGGGGGGQVVLYAKNSGGASVSIAVRGGTGGNNTGAGAPHGPGGGGGGGVVSTNVAASNLTSGAANGTTASDATYGTSYGATAGGAGGSGSIATTSFAGTSSGGECAPSVAKSFSLATAGVNQPVTLTVTLGNPHGSMSMTPVALTDTYPTNMLNAPTPAASTTCGGSVAATAGQNKFVLSGATLAAGATCTVTVSVVGASPGALTNTIPAGAGGVAAGTTGGWTTNNVYAAGAGLTVSAPLSASKTVAAVSDPINGASNPKAIPGALLDYTITVSNPTGHAIDANTVVVGDAMPANAKLRVSDLGAAGSGPVALVDGTPASGLTYSYSGLGQAGSLTFSKDNGATYTYVPTVGASGVDPLVTNIRVAPTGSMATGSSFSLRFRVVVQ